MKEQSTRVTAYVRVRTVKETCSHGYEHEVEYYTQKFLERTGEYVMDNGYEKRKMPTWRDAQGREWRSYRSYDYWAHVVHRHRG